MRCSFVLLLLLTVAGCRCSPANPQAVTLRVVNSTRSPIYVDTTAGRLGLTVQRDVGGTLFGFDDLACTCRFCENACSSACSCPDAGAPAVLKIEAGGQAQRTWDGVVQVAGFSTCSSDGCLDQQNAPLNEPFTLELCYSVQRPTGVNFNDAGVGAGSLPKVSSTCTTRQFAPQDGEVEIGPVRGSSCTTTADCKGAGELCFDKACTTGCPANAFPVLGSDWMLAVASPDNMGFFEMTARPTGNQFSGTGTLTSAVYQSGTLLLSFSRPGPVSGEQLTGRVQIKLPTGTGAPLTPGGMVSVTLLDDGDAQAPSRALVMKDAASGEVLLAVDMGQGRRLLTEAEISPFQVADGNAPQGCALTSCGRLLFYSLSLSAGGKTVEVLPGAQSELTLGSSRWNFLNVSSGAYVTTTCDVKDLRPWAFWKVSQ